MSSWYFFFFSVIFFFSVCSLACSRSSVGLRLGGLLLSLGVLGLQLLYRRVNVAVEFQPLLI